MLCVPLQHVHTSVNIPPNISFKVEVCQALEMYKVTMQTFQLDVDDTIVSDAQQLYANAVANKVTGVLCVHYIRPGENLRANVQAELKSGLRAHGLHESTSLHPLLFGQVQRTLKVLVGSKHCARPVVSKIFKLLWRGSCKIAAKVSWGDSTCENLVAETLELMIGDTKPCRAD
eukprot:6363831-Amphidinium_carterae.3